MQRPPGACCSALQLWPASPSLASASLTTRSWQVTSCAGAEALAIWRPENRCGLQLVAGEQIETSFGASLGLSTLAAAALGNMVSDICGVGVAGHIEVRLESPAPADLADP